MTAKRIYRAVPVSLWRSPRFRGLNTAARELYLYALTGPQTTKVPGVGYFSVPIAADDLARDQRTVATAIAAVRAAGLADFDPEARLLCAWDALEDQPPRTADHIAGWTATWIDLPKCALLDKVRTHFAQWFATNKPELLAKFVSVAGVAPPSPDLSNPSQEKEKEPEKEKEKEKERKQAPSLPTVAPVDPGRGADSAAVPAVVDALESGRDQWPNIPATALLDVARRIARDVAAEPTTERDGIDPLTATREALPKVRAWAAEHPVSSAESRLARVEVFIGYILGDSRKGTRRPSRPVGPELDEIKRQQRKHDRDEQEKIAEAQRRAPRPSPAAIADVIANMGKPAKGAA